MAQTTGFNLPPPQEPFVVAGSLSLSYSGYQFLLSGFNSAASSLPTATVAPGLAASGTNQATALQLTAQWNEVDTVEVGTGVLLSAYQVGQSQTVFNGSVNPLLVYPPPGLQIDALGDNEPYSLPAGSRIAFETWSDSQIRS